MKKRYTISAEWNDARLDRFIRALMPDITFPNVQTLLRKKRILLNGEKTDGQARLKTGDVVETLMPGKDRAPADGLKADPVKKWGSIGEVIPVLYEDDQILAINKPAGLVVQPGNRKELGSLLDLLERYRSRREPGVAAELPVFPYTPAHRLDRETSGVLVIAKVRTAARALSGMFARGEATKVYLALVWGTPSPKKGVISTPLKTEKGESSKTLPAADGKPARSAYTVIRSFPDGSSLLEVTITTGRTHQIRAHLASIGFPLCGDKKYGGKKDAPPPGDKHGSNRLLLHAWKLAFPHPESGRRLELSAPPPEGFSR
ncbi:MAG: RluA family pseudouridine synthase [Candidatus Krumholzibacteriota bacterium]|nr:RluA family pseudouridine synthase [Candidatus Krumholzibacteriota bacterium]